VKILILVGYEARVPNSTKTSYRQSFCYNVNFWNHPFLWILCEMQRQLYGNGKNVCVFLRTF